ncbi:transposable element Tc1 transposase [Trichonephila clavipes]|nr:transposable element Tc1 transposase [Trichonephila clavipes]
MEKDGKSHRDISRFIGRQYSSIQHVIYNFKSTRVYTSKHRLSRPSKLTIREKRKVERLLENLMRTSQLKRIAFTKDHIHRSLEFWRTVIFSDEGNFCIFGIKGRKLVWRKSCTALQKEYLVPTVKHGGGGVLVWVSNGVGKIRQYNASSKDMLKSVLKDQWEKISAEETTRFVSSMLKRLQEVLN